MPGSMIPPGEANERRKTSIGASAATDPRGLASFCGFGRCRDPGSVAGGRYRVSLADRAVANSRTRRNAAGFDDGGADFRELPVLPNVRGRHPERGAGICSDIGRWQLKGIDLVKFNELGEMSEFEIMIRPIKGLQALAEEIGN